MLPSSTFFCSISWTRILTRRGRVLLRRLVCALRHLIRGYQRRVLLHCASPFGIKSPPSRPHPDKPRITDKLAAPGDQTRSGNLVIIPCSSAIPRLGDKQQRQSQNCRVWRETVECYISCLATLCLEQMHKPQCFQSMEARSMPDACSPACVLTMFIQQLLFT